MISGANLFIQRVIIIIMCQSDKNFSLLLLSIHWHLYNTFQNRFPLCLHECTLVNNSNCQIKVDDPVHNICTYKKSLPKKKPHVRFWLDGLSLGCLVRWFGQFVDFLKRQGSYTSMLLLEHLLLRNEGKAVNMKRLS